MTTPIVLTIGVVIAFPLLKMAGVEIRSSYIVAASAFLGAIAVWVAWRNLRGLFRR